MDRNLQPENIENMRFEISFKDLYCLSRLLHSARQNSGNPFCECQYCRYECHVWDENETNAKVLAPNYDFLAWQLMHITGVYLGPYRNHDVSKEKSPCFKDRDFSNETERKKFYEP